MRGRFVVLEGMDGAGTTTQARAVVDALLRAGRQVRYTREPSDGRVGAYIREVLRGKVAHSVSERTLAVLFAADRSDHLDAEIEPALREGVDVISDRYVLSSLAYQGVMTGDPAWVAALNAGVRRPDLTVLLDVSPELAARRRAGRDGAPERYEVEETQRAVDAAYRKLAEDWRALVVDRSRDKAAATHDILAAIEAIPR